MSQLQLRTSNYRKHTTKNPLKKFFFANFENNLVSLVGSLNPKKILDAGCGEGFTLAKLYELKIGNELVGIDSSKIAIQTGKENFPYLNLKIGDIYNLPYKDNSFDLVICTEVLEHLSDPQKALSDILRASSKYLLLTVPNEPWFLLSNFTQWGKDIGHINHWSSSAFCKFILNYSSLIIKEVRHPFPWTMILAEKNNSKKV